MALSCNVAPHIRQKFLLQHIKFRIDTHIMCQLRNFKLVARASLVQASGGSDDTALLPLILLKIRFVRMLDTIVCFDPLIWLRKLAVLSGLGLQYIYSPWTLDSSVLSWSLNLLIQE
jgi:hypothetical protein